MSGPERADVDDLIGPLRRIRQAEDDGTGLDLTADEVKGLALALRVLAKTMNAMMSGEDRP